MLHLRSKFTVFGAGLLLGYPSIQNDAVMGISMIAPSPTDGAKKGDCSGSTGSSSGRGGSGNRRCQPSTPDSPSEEEETDSPNDNNTGLYCFHSASGGDSEAFADARGDAGVLPANANQTHTQSRHTPSTASVARPSISSVNWLSVSPYREATHTGRGKRMLTLKVMAMNENSTDTVLNRERLGKTQELRIELGSEIARGSFGAVLRGKIVSPEFFNGKDQFMEVAVKRMPLTRDGEAATTKTAEAGSCLSFLCVGAATKKPTLRPTSRSRFDNEVRLLQKADSPTNAKIVPAFYGATVLKPENKDLYLDKTARPQGFIVLQLAATDLKAELKQQPGTQIPSTEKFFETVIDSVEVFQRVLGLRKKQIVHSDIKPENVLILQGDQSVRLTDFGLGVDLSEKSQELSSPNRNSFGGTRLYMSGWALRQQKSTQNERPAVLHPEQRYNYDLWSACATVFEIVAKSRLIQLPESINNAQQAAENYITNDFTLDKLNSQLGRIAEKNRFKKLEIAGLDKFLAKIAASEFATLTLDTKKSVFGTLFVALLEVLMKHLHGGWNSYNVENKFKLPPAVVPAEALEDFLSTMAQIVLLLMEPTNADKPKEGEKSFQEKVARIVSEIGVLKGELERLNEREGLERRVREAAQGGGR